MSTQNLYSELSEAPTPVVHRIGSVSRLAGVPVSTLRMWESRHAAFAPAKTDGQHRLYREDDVVRARLLRQLTEAGHSIGGIAQLPAPHLQQLLAAARARDPNAFAAAGPQQLAMVVIGAALAARITAREWSARLPGQVVRIARAFSTIDEAAAAPSVPAADLLMARVNAVHPRTCDALAALRDACGARHGVVLYNFGAETNIAALRNAGFIVRREPVDEADLAELVRSTVWARAERPSAEPGTAAIPAPIYSEEDLARVAASPTRMLCECPRHLADILLQLSSFEEYSAQCLNESEEDARVHAQLRSVAGSARALFEGALTMVLAHNDAGA